MRGLRAGPDVVGAVLLLLAPVRHGAGALRKYPDKPIRLVVPFPPGGPTDVFARVLVGRPAPSSSASRW